jgi:hypothetical protein
VAVGALVAGGALMRSCSPVDARTTRIDLSDMKDGEARFYSFGTFSQIVVRNGDALTIWDGMCPVSAGWALMAPSDGLIWCTHCTSRFDLAGNITQFWSNPNPPADAPNLSVGQVQTEGLSLLIAENQSLPELGWSSL